MDKLIARFGVTIWYGSAYSPWSNGINEHNHVIKKIMEEKKVALTDSFVKEVYWTHNTNVNKLGYTPLQLVMKLWRVFWKQKPCRK